MTTFPSWILFTRYDRILISTLNVWYYRAIIKFHNRTASIFTFDDGSTNFYQKAAALFDRSNAKDHFYNIPFIGLPIDKIINEVKGHYTIYPELDNIVEPERRILVELGKYETNDAFSASEVKIFIGQNFHEYIDKSVKEKMESFLRSDSFAYFPHPREQVDGSSFYKGLNIIKSPLIMEDYVEQQLKIYKKVSLFGAYSTALMTVRGERLEKIYLFADGKKEKQKIMTSFGCRVFEI